MISTRISLPVSRGHKTVQPPPLTSCRTIPQHPERLDIDMLAALACTPKRFHPLIYEISTDEHAIHYRSLLRIAIQSTFHPYMGNFRLLRRARNHLLHPVDPNFHHSGRRIRPWSVEHASWGALGVHTGKHPYLERDLRCGAAGL